MFNVGGAEMLVIFLVALLILGPDKLPAAARQAGAFMAKVRQYSDGFRSEIQRAMDEAVDTDAKEAGAKLSVSEQPDPDVHEVKAVAEPEVHPELGAEPAAEDSETTLRAVPDPGAPDPAPAATDTGPEATDDPDPGAAAI